MKAKYYANKDVERNKKPLQNIMYRFVKVKKRNEEYYVCYWKYQKQNIWSFNGKIEKEKIKEKLSEKQWSEFIGEEKVNEFIAHNKKIRKKI